jgi:hypothetical protein
MPNPKASSMRRWSQLQRHRRLRHARTTCDSRHDSVEIEVVRKIFENWMAQTPPGWRRLISRTVDKLVAVMEPREQTKRSIERRRKESLSATQLQPREIAPFQRQRINRFEAILSMAYIASDTEIQFGLDPAADSVVWGILRKAMAASQCTCRQCGAAGRLRMWTIYGAGASPEGSPKLFRAAENLDNPVDHFETLCVDCAAPQMLQEHLCVLSECIGLLQKRGQPVTLADVPPLLHPSFLIKLRKQAVERNRLIDRRSEASSMACDDDENHDENTLPARMSLSLFVDWAHGWMEIRRRLSP